MCCVGYTMCRDNSRAMLFNRSAQHNQFKCWVVDQLSSCSYSFHFVLITNKGRLIYNAIKQFYSYTYQRAKISVANMLLLNINKSMSTSFPAIFARRPLIFYTVINLIFFERYSHRRYVGITIERKNFFFALFC